MTDEKKPKGPTVPVSQEELDQEAADQQAQDNEIRANAAIKARQSARLMLMCAAGTSAVAVVVALALYPGATAWGVVAGCSVMTANLWILSQLLSRVLLADGNKTGSIVLLVASFGGLAAFSFALVTRRPDMALGFGLGLSVPALGGLLWSLFRRGG